MRFLIDTLLFGFVVGFLALASAESAVGSLLACRGSVIVWNDGNREGEV